MPESGREYMERKLAERRAPRAWSRPDYATDGIVDAWDELGSDMEMELDVLARVRQEAIEAELVRARRIARRSE